MAGFMQLRVWQEQGVEALDPDDDTNSYLMPASVAAECSDAPFPEIDNAAWWAQYTAPGYLDQTDSVYGETAVEAARECFALFGAADSPADRSELATILWQCRKADRS